MSIIIRIFELLRKIWQKFKLLSEVWRLDSRSTDRQFHEALGTWLRGRLLSLSNKILQDFCIMHCDWLKKVTGHEAMCQGLRETAWKYLSKISIFKQEIMDYLVNFEFRYISNVLFGEWPFFTFENLPYCCVTLLLLLIVHVIKLPNSMPK